MNHAIFIVKITGSPIYILYEEKKEYENIEIEVQFASPRQKSSKNKLQLFLWGECQKDFIKYYDKNVEKYFIVEGIITLKGYDNVENEAKIIAKKIYPLIVA
uniref:Uncharacterized protein n=1 Tax=Akkesiphycus lubricus TaxID=3022 RepID=A0A8F0F6Y8_AKKLU|nr:hypothetical protein [Akkesiphycus lubricus]